MKRVFFCLAVMLICAAKLISQESGSEKTFIEECVESISSISETDIEIRGKIYKITDSVDGILEKINEAESLKIFDNENASVFYILNQASVLKNYTPAYSFNGESDSKKWPQENLEQSSFTVDSNASGYRLISAEEKDALKIEGKHLIRYDVEANSRLAKKRLSEWTNFVEPLVAEISSADYDFETVDDKKYFKSKKSLVLYDEQFSSFELFKNYSKYAVAYYILNKASLASGYVPAYSVGGETDPDKWPKDFFSSENFLVRHDAGFYIINLGENQVAAEVLFADSGMIEKAVEKNLAEENAKRDLIVYGLVADILSADFDLVDEQFILRTKNEVPVYDKKLSLYEPFKSYGPAVSAYYIMNKASLASGYVPVYSYNGENNPEKWPAGYIDAGDFESDSRGGFYRDGNLLDSDSAVLYFVDSTKIEQVLDRRKVEEKKRLEEQRLAAENAKRDALIEKIGEQIFSADYKLEIRDGIAFNSTEQLYLANELSMYEPFKTYRNGKWESCYVLNKLSIKKGLTPVYSVDGESDPEKWSVERKSNKVLPEINQQANGYRRNEYQYDWHFTVSYMLNEEEKKVEEEKEVRRVKSQLGNEYLDLMGMSFKEIDGEGINLVCKKTSENKKGIVEATEGFKIFEIVTENKSMARIYGFKPGDLIVVDFGDRNLSSKIIVDSKVYDLASFGNSAEVVDICSIFENAMKAKKVTIQVRRKEKKGYDQKEITIRN